MDVPLNLLIYIIIPAVLSVSWMRYKGMEYILIHYRWIFVCLFLLPLSVLYDALMYLRLKLVFAFNSAPKQHDKRVKFVQQQVITEF